MRIYWFFTKALISPMNRKIFFLVFVLLKIVVTVEHIYVAGSNVKTKLLLFAVNCLLKLCGCLVFEKKTGNERKKATI